MILTRNACRRIETNVDDIVAAFDMDGTLADYDAGMFAALQELHSEYEPPLAFERMHNLPPVYERRRKLICKVPGFWINLKPFELGFNVLRGAVEAGFDSNCCTCWRRLGSCSKQMVLPATFRSDCGSSSLDSGVMPPPWRMA